MWMHFLMCVLCIQNDVTNKFYLVIIDGNWDFFFRFLHSYFGIVFAFEAFILCNKYFEVVM